MTIIVTALVTFLVTTVVITNTKGINLSNNKSDLEKKIETVKQYLDENYLGEEDENKLTDGAIKGYVSGLNDEYTEYLTQDEYNDLMVSVNGNYVGIGIYMAKDKNDNVIVVVPIEGSPAEEAGLKSGDIITKVNGEECSSMDLNIVANKVKGEEGTTVDLEIKRDNQTFTKTIQRRKVEIKDMSSKVLDNNIGYIEILSFDDGCANEFKQNLEDLKGKGIKSLIIDVRDNGGGVVSEVLKIADMLVDKDKTLMITVNKNNKEKSIKSEQDSMVDGMKMVILTNENSASASEILAGALKDNGVAKVVGKTTFGKGVMQEVFPMDFGGALKITIQEFKTPNGDTINKKGVTPDTEVDQSQDKTTDLQLNKAIELLK
jgi:carboxyl-terminal processing protease